MASEAMATESDDTAAGAPVVAPTQAQDGAAVTAPADVATETLNEVAVQDSAAPVVDPTPPTAGPVVDVETAGSGVTTENAPLPAGAPLLIPTQPVDDNTVASGTSDLINTSTAGDVVENTNAVPAAPAAEGASVASTSSAPLLIPVNAGDDVTMADTTADLVNTSVTSDAVESANAAPAAAGGAALVGTSAPLLIPITNPVEDTPMVNTTSDPMNTSVTSDVVPADNINVDPAAATGGAAVVGTSAPLLIPITNPVGDTPMVDTTSDLMNTSVTSDVVPAESTNVDPAAAAGGAAVVGTSAPLLIPITNPVEDNLMINTTSGPIDGVTTTGIPENTNAAAEGETTVRENGVTFLSEPIRNDDEDIENGNYGQDTYIPAPLPPEEPMQELSALSAVGSLPTVEEMRTHHAASSMILSEASIMDNATPDVSVTGDKDDDDNMPSHSLPSPDEIGGGRGRNARARVKKQFYLSVGALVLVVIAIIGLSWGIMRSNSSSGSERMRQTIKLLERVSSAKSLLEDGSPQNMAAKWIADLDELEVDLPTDVYADDAYPFIQRYALATIYFATGGPQWSLQLGFLSKREECEWWTLFNTEEGPFQVGVTCDEDRKVERLLIPGNSLTGELPPETALLNDLNHISMYSNGLSGTLPSEMQRLSKLDFIAFNNNNLSGNIPNWLGDLPVLRILGLGNNKFSGRLPSSIKNMMALRECSLDDNELFGDIDVFNNLENLQSLYLEDNLFSGEIGENFLNKMSSLETLDLSDNEFEGEVPVHLLTHPSLTVVDLHDNSIGGPFPSGLNENNKLEFLALHGNFLSSELPSEIRQLKALRHLDLSQNNFDGEMPESLGDLSNLQYLFLGDNAFSPGKIPDFLQELSNLEELSLKSSARGESIPDWIGTKLTKLLLLDLSDNDLTGQVPESIGDLTGAAFLLLNHNVLSGDLPDLQRLTNLAMILIDNNDIQGDADELGICEGEQLNLGNLQVFTSDCSSDTPKFVCPCCTECCDAATSCRKDSMMLANLDPYWENGYARQMFVFSEDIIFSVNPKD